MRKVNKDTGGNSQKVKSSQGGNKSRGDPKPKRVVADWAMGWAAGRAPGETWDGLIRQGRQDLGGRPLLSARGD